MTTSPGESIAASSFNWFSVGSPLGSISQTTRGAVSLLTASATETAATMLVSAAKPATVAASRS